MKRLLTLSTAATVAAVAGSGALLPSAAHAAGSGKDHETGRVVGAWRMTVDPRPVQGPTGTIDVPPFASLVTLHQGGTLTDAVSALPGAASALLRADDYTNGVGVWSASKKTVKFRFQRFFTKDGAFVGSQVVVGTGRMKQRRTVQVATATFYDSAGNLIGVPVTIDATGTRMTP